MSTKLIHAARGVRNPLGIHVVPGLNAHCDFDECPARGPYQIHGLSMLDNRGIVWADSEAEAVEKAQERDADAYHATALDPEDLLLVVQS